MKIMNTGYRGERRGAKKETGRKGDKERGRQGDKDEVPGEGREARGIVLRALMSTY